MPLFEKPFQVVLVAAYSFPQMGFEKPESVLSCVWYFVAPLLGFQKSTTVVPETLAPLAGLVRVGRSGTLVVVAPFTKYRYGDHEDHPLLLPARARQ